MYGESIIHFSVSNVNVQFILYFLSFKAHYSIVKGASFLGFGQKNVLRVETDEKGMMKPCALERNIQACIKEVRYDFFMVNCFD